MKLIQLAKGYAAIVDDEDFEMLSRRRWKAEIRNNKIYAIRSIRVNGCYKRVAMHRAILAAPVGIEVDHINGNSLDNRRLNLRLATRSENIRNSKTKITNKLGVKGVCRWRKKYMAQIVVDRKHIYLGVFNTVTEAKAAYDSAAAKHHGEFARLN